MVQQEMRKLGLEADEKVGIGSIDTICGIVKEKQLSSPAIIVIGDVVNERTILNSIISEVNQNTITV